MAENLNPGDGVLFEGGQTFNDNPLMPDNAHNLIFGSYGSGQAHLPQGAWLFNVQDSTIQNLKLGNLSGAAPSHYPSADDGSKNILIQGNTIYDPTGSGTAINSNANDVNWQIVGNLIQNTGDSGLFLHGRDGG